MIPKIILKTGTKNKYSSNIPKIALYFLSEEIEKKNA